MYVYYGIISLFRRNVTPFVFFELYFSQQPTYLVQLQYCCDIPRTLRSSVFKQSIVSNTNLNIGKGAFSVAAPTIWNQLPIIIKSSEIVATFHKTLDICLKLLFHHNLSAVPCSNYDPCLSQFMTMLIGFVTSACEFEFSDK